MNDLLEILLSKKVVVPERYEQYKDIFRHFRGKQVTVGDLNIKGKSPTNIFDDPTKFYRSSGNDGFLMGDVLENLPPIWLGKKVDDGSVTTKKLLTQCLWFSQPNVIVRLEATAVTCPTSEYVLCIQRLKYWD